MALNTLKILLTDPHLRGGGQVRYLNNLASELVRMGHSVTVGCKTGSVLVDIAEAVGCQVNDEFVFKGGIRPRAWLHDISEVKKFIRIEKPDIIHVNGSQDHWTCALANRMLGRPVCVVRTRHNTYRVHDALPNRILNYDWTDFQIVVCDVVRDNLSNQPSFDPQRMCTIHNGVDASLFKPDDEARLQARKELGYTNSEIVCGIAARLVIDKGHEYLLRAIKKLHEDIPELRVLILGQGGLDNQLKQLSCELGLESSVNFAGFLPNMEFYTQAFDIAVLPSIGCDTSSFSLKEEMAAEKPVVASDYGGLPEIVNDAVEGIVVSAGEVDSLADAIGKLAKTPELRSNMGRAGRQRVLNDFTVQIFAEKTVEAYRKAIEIHHDRNAC